MLDREVDEFSEGIGLFQQEKVAENSTKLQSKYLYNGTMVMMMKISFETYRSLITM